MTSFVNHIFYLSAIKVLLPTTLTNMKTAGIFPCLSDLRGFRCVGMRDEREGELWTRMRGQ